MTVTASSIKFRFPEFNDLDDGYINEFIGIASIVISNESCYCSLLDDAVSFYTAHLLVTVGSPSGSGTGTSGPVKAEKVGDLSRSYASMSSGSALSKSALSASKYGIQLWGLRASTVCGAPMVIV